MRDPEVRQMAAFALGLLGDDAATRSAGRRARRSVAARAGQRRRSARPDRRCGSGRRRSARCCAGSSQSGALAQTPPDDDDVRRDTPAAAFRLGVYALVRLKAYAPLAAAVLDASAAAARPLVAGGVRAAAARRQARAAALLTLAKDAHPYTRAFAVKGLGALKDRAAVPALMPLLSSGDRPCSSKPSARSGASATARRRRRWCKIIDDANERSRTCGSKP